jgi:UDP-N-acetylglucosamine 4-epimerase
VVLGLIPRSIENPIVTNEYNLTGFLNMVMAAKDANVERFVCATSSFIYDDRPTLLKIEDQTGNPLRPILCIWLKYIGLRYFNAFGSRQNPNDLYAAVIPKWFAGLLNGKEYLLMIMRKQIGIFVSWKTLFKPTFSRHVPKKVGR